jgi:hypothetical protein
MPIGGGPARRLVEGAFPFWSQDGKWIYYTSGYPGSSTQIWKISPTGGQPIQVTRNGGFQPMESSDGKFLYYGKDMKLRSLWKMPVAGGEEHHLFDTQGEWSSYTLADDTIYYITGTLSMLETSPRASIDSFRLSMGARQHITTIDQVLWSDLSISPDRRFLFYSRLDHQTSDLMLVENFR